MPVQRLAIIIGHNIGPGDSVIHGVERGLLHDMGQKTGKSGPVIKLGHGAALDLISTDCVIGGFKLSQGWMICCEAGNLLFKVDVMDTLMNKGLRRDHWFHPVERAFYGFRAQETREVEQSLSL